MKITKEFFDSIKRHLDGLAQANAVVAKTVSVGERHAIPLCELSFALGGGGAMGEGEHGSEDSSGGTGSGSAGAAGGGAQAAPVAVILVDGDEVRVERIKV